MFVSHYDEATQVMVAVCVCGEWSRTDKILSVRDMSDHNDARAEHLKDAQEGS